MGLADYKPLTRDFVLKGGSFSVEGLSLEMLSSLVRTHLSDLERLFELTGSVLKGKTEIDESNLEEVALVLAKELPALVSSVIAHASGDTSEAAVAAAAKLPFPVQVDVITAIGSLTFEEVGGIKKFVELIKTLVTKAQNK